ncbi:MAG: DoxX family protein [Saprospiraceae bacterium]
MTILTLCGYIALVAGFMTFLMFKYSEEVKSIWLSFLQNFCGALFIFSGFVKAVDPLGTAYKMEEYFTEFENTAKGTFLNFTSSIFPILAKYAIGFSVFMIVLEIMIGLMLILGYKNRLSSWLFFLIMVFFTVLTGFTYLTAYVPREDNFFEFAKWTAFNAENMRVTNCGCFGDFIKLDPKTSFTKDLFLMIPALIFLFSWRKFHSIFSSSIRSAISLLTLVGLILFCIANYKWNEPMIDFRPFRIGTDVKTIKAAELKAMADIKIEQWKLKNRTTNEIKLIPDEEYMKNIKSYPKTDWEVVDQIKSTPSIPKTKIADFAMYDLDGNDVTDLVLDEPRSRIMVNCPKLFYTSETTKSTIMDTVWKTDTVFTLKNPIPEIMRTVAEVKEKTVKTNHYIWEEEYKKTLTTKILPFLDSIRQDSIKAFFVCGGASEDALKALFGQLNVNIPIYTADDILLKTIMRSNPGILLWRNGKIIMKWHYKLLPDMTEMRRDFLDWNAPIIH